MQSYRDINDSDYISDAPAVLNGNFKSIASDFRGASFPTTNLIEGMNCFRTDSSIMYQLDTDLKTWKPLYKVLTSGIEVEQAKHATNADVAETLIDALYASKTEAETGTDTTKVMTAARVKDAILKLAPKPAMASQAEAEAGVDNTKVMTPLRTKQAVEKFAPLKTVNGQKPNVSGDVEILDLTPVGDVVYRPYLRAGYVKANGATVNRADYPNLVSFATDNNLWTDSPSTEPWKYGRGNGSTTMVLPDYRNRFIQGGDNSGIKSAGLPDIKGTITQIHSRDYVKGAFSINPNENIAICSIGGSAHHWDRAQFDASRFNPIYGASTTVQPSAICLIPQIRY